MTEEYRKAIYDLIYLSSCAIRAVIPEKERVAQINLEELYKAAETHMMTAIAAAALERAGVKNEAFTQAKGNAIRKNVLLNAEQTIVQEKLEAAGIWHVLLKGAVLKDLYPAVGMRQMTDIDILIDKNRTQDVREIMEGLGFTHKLRSSIHDTYVKPPVSNFEMHYQLFGARPDKQLYLYYRNIKTKLVHEEGCEYRLRFTKEDNYIYIIAHEYKHYSDFGIGLRTLFDIYLYRSRYGSTMDWTYIRRELEALGLQEFEQLLNRLSLHVVQDEALAKDDYRMLEYVFSSGNSGLLQNHVNHMVDYYGGNGLGKLRYVLSRLFLPAKSIRACYPFFDRHPYLLPFFPLYHLTHGLISRRKHIKKEINALFKYHNERTASAPDHKS